MRTKKIKIVFVVILLIILITIFTITILNNITLYTATITKIYDNSIIIEDDSRLVALNSNNIKNTDSYGRLVHKGNNVYGTAKNLIYLEDALILDINCRKISKENLKIGDKICIISVNASHNQIASVPSILYNVRFIKVLENAITP